MQVWDKQPQKHDRRSDCTSLVAFKIAFPHLSMCLERRKDASTSICIERNYGIEEGAKEIVAAVVLEMLG